MSAALERRPHLPTTGADNFTKVKQLRAEMGLGRSNTRHGWARTTV
ncbi:MAG: hypothetical protein ACRDYY_13145 [Acidimicrobiales bacterium]